MILSTYTNYTILKKEQMYLTGNVSETQKNQYMLL